MRAAPFEAAHSLAPTLIPRPKARITSSRTDNRRYDRQTSTNPNRSYDRMTALAPRGSLR
jgi:hypothetical protein